MEISSKEKLYNLQSIEEISLSYSSLIPLPLWQHFFAVSIRYNISMYHPARNPLVLRPQEDLDPKINPRINFESKFQTLDNELIVIDKEALKTFLERGTHSYEFDPKLKNSPTFKTLTGKIVQNHTSLKDISPLELMLNPDDLKQLGNTSEEIGQKIQEAYSLPKPEYNLYLNRPLWTLGEFICLLSGYDPAEFSICFDYPTFWNYRKVSVSSLTKVYELFDKRLKKSSTAPFYKAPPKIWIQWAKFFKLALPTELAEADGSSPSKSVLGTQPKKGRNKVPNPSKANRIESALIQLKKDQVINVSNFVKPDGSPIFSALADVLIDKGRPYGLSDEKKGTLKGYSRRTIVSHLSNLCKAGRLDFITPTGHPNSP